MTLEVGGESIAPGERLRFELPAALLPTHTPVSLPLTVVNGVSDGPIVWISAAVHGDELNGVEIISRVLDRLDAPLRRGAIIAMPIVNVFGFLNQSRYLPDRRDLNRSFPGSKNGPLAGRIAYLFMKEIVARCTHGIDLHTGSNERTNLSQVRGQLTDPETRRIAEAFAAPVMVQSAERDGSLRAAATKLGVPVLLFEGGEPRRFNEEVIRYGVQGVIGVLQELRMIKGRKKRPPSLHIDKCSWARARRGGLLRLNVKEGDRVAAKQELGRVSDPFGDEGVAVRSPFEGVVIGLANNPVVYGGDAVVNVGRVTL